MLLEVYMHHFVLNHETQRSSIHLYRCEYLQSSCKKSNLIHQFQYLTYTRKTCPVFFFGFFNKQKKPRNNKLDHPRHNINEQLDDGFFSKKKGCN